MLTLQSVSLEGRIDNIDLHIQQGQWWMLLGPNGAGKSSLLSVCAGLSSANGRIMFDEEPLQDYSLAQLAKLRCLVTQQHDSHFAITVEEALSFFTAQITVPDLLETHLSITPLLRKKLDQLSGGEAQRVHLARCLMQVWPAIERGDALLLLDEPLQQMDVKHQLAALGLFRHLHEGGNTIVMSHHDINHAVQYGRQACLLKHAMLMHQGEIDRVLTLDNLTSLYEQEFHILLDEQNRPFFVARNTC